MKQPPRWRSITKQRYEELPKIGPDAPETLIDSILAKSPVKMKKPAGIAATKREEQAGPTSNGEQEDLIPRSQIDSTDVAPNSRPTCGARVTHALVITYHEQLGKVYYFDFWAAPDDFVQSSAKFNQILNSVRFLS